MKSLDKLREVARQREVPTTTKLVTTYVRPSSELRYWTEHDIADALEAAIGEIEKELGERYMPLPLDAYGVPIHVGDRMEHHDEPRVVEAVDESHVWLSVGGYAIKAVPYVASELHHYRSDTWERIIADAYDGGYRDPDNKRLRERLVERCKALAGEGE